MTFEEYNYAIEDLNKATVAYDKGQPIMTDKEWDDLYFAVSEYALEENPVPKIKKRLLKKLNQYKVEHEVENKE